MASHQDAVRVRLGQLITEGYTAIGESRRSMAQALGASDRTLYAIENGLTTPRKATRVKLEEFLGWKRGSISELLSVGPDVDLGQVSVATMRAVAPAGWGEPVEVESDGVLARKVTLAVSDLLARLEERDAEVQRLRDEVRVLREKVGAAGLTQNDVDLAADKSPNQGAALRDFLDDVAEGNRSVPTDG